MPSKKELQERVELLDCIIDGLCSRIHKLESKAGNTPHLIETAVKPLKENLAFNANLMNLLMEYFNIGFYETPAQTSKIQIKKKEKVSDNPSKRKGR